MAFATEPSVVTAMMNMEPESSPTSSAESSAEELKALRTQLGITGYPALLLFPETASTTTAETEIETQTETDTAKWIVYSGPRKHKDILLFLNEHAGTFRHPNGTLGTDAALVPQVDALVTTTKTYDEAFLAALETLLGGMEGGGATSARQEAYGLYRSYGRKVRGDAV